jgi:hypothetical protein
VSSKRPAGHSMCSSEGVAGATYDDDEKLEISEFYKDSNGLLIYIISSYKQDGDCRDINIETPIVKRCNSTNR